MLRELLALDRDAENPLHGVALRWIERWIERNGWWAVMGLAVTLGSVVWGLRQAFDDDLPRLRKRGLRTWGAWRSQGWRENRYVVIPVALAVLLVIVAAVLGW